MLNKIKIIEVCFTSKYHFSLLYLKIACSMYYLQFLCYYLWFLQAILEWKLLQSKSYAIFSVYLLL